MFSTLGQKILLGVYIFLILSIPVGSYFVSEYQTTLKSKAAEPKTAITFKVIPSPQSNAKNELLDLAKKQATPKPSPTPESSPGVTTSFGPSLSLKATLEGRPKDNQSVRLFIGIVEGTISVNPRFLLSFTIDLPKSGEYSDLSLAGLNPGTSYSALLKGSAQIATASAFLMSPTVSNLNSGNAILLTSGDLNEDNTINTADYSIAQKALGSNPKSSNWNENVDLNRDNVVNSLDLGTIIKNLGKTGDSGVWTSPVPIATPSGALTPLSTESATLPVGSAINDSNSGYWLWIPK